MVGNRPFIYLIFVVELTKNYKREQKIWQKKTEKLSSGNYCCQAQVKNNCSTFVRKYGGPP